MIATVFNVMHLKEVGDIIFLVVFRTVSIRSISLLCCVKVQVPVMPLTDVISM